MRAVVLAGNPENVRVDGFSGYGLRDEAVEKREPATQDEEEISSRCRGKKTENDSPSPVGKYFPEMKIRALNPLNRGKNIEHPTSNIEHRTPK